MRAKPTAALLDVRAEAIRLGRDGMSGGVRGRSHSVSSVLGLQYGVQCPQQMTNSYLTSELTEIREMMKLQQEQLTKLTQSLSSLQGHQQGRSTFNRGPAICRRCQQPGHFARECDGVRFATPQSTSQTQQSARQSHRGPQSEN